MATKFELDCALMAGASYFSTRADKNRFPIPQGWTSVIDPPHFKDDVTGFEAVAFTDGTDIVISFAGTYDQSAADLTADANLISGVISDQLIQAAEYYLQVKAGAPAGTTITLTGHSLGGGLAALLAVFFGESAMTFDQAPFRNSASMVVATALRSSLANSFSAGALFSLDKFIWSFDPLGLGWSPYGLDARETKISNISVQGEVASISNSFKIGTELAPLINGDYAHPVDLHSQTLLTAFLQSQQTAASGKALNDVTFKLTDLLGMIFDDKLFAHPTDPRSTDVNFLEHSSVTKRVLLPILSLVRQPLLPTPWSPVLPPTCGNSPNLAA